MKVSEMRDMTIEELSEKEREMRKELFNLRFQAATGEIENPRRIRAVRKDMARVLTVMTEKARASKERGK
ncbi:MAG: 50S ribosomal protein L29 [Thermodesulfovibrionales bacterium]